MTVPLFTYSLAHRGLTQSWRHAITPERAEDVSAEMEAGKAGHRVLLGKGHDIIGLDFRDWRTNAAKAARDDARARSLTPLLMHKFHEIEDMVVAVRTQLSTVEPPTPFTDDGYAEQSIFWSEDGVDCRATPDWMTLDRRYIFDLKTTNASAHPGQFSRTLWDKGYDLQCALYLRAVKRSYGVDAEFRFVVCETSPPYALSVVALDPEALAFANTRLDYALAGWRRCLETGEFPGYPTRTAYAEVPVYLKAAWEMRSYYEGVA